jgi:hypothetical protein
LSRSFDTYTADPFIDDFGGGSVTLIGPAISLTGYVGVPSTSMLLLE